MWKSIADFLAEKHNGKITEIIQEIYGYEIQPDNENDSIRVEKIHPGPTTVDRGANKAAHRGNRQD